MMENSGDRRQSFTDFDFFCQKGSSFPSVLTNTLWRFKMNTAVFSETLMAAAVSLGHVLRGVCVAISHSHEGTWELASDKS